MSTKHTATPRLRAMKKEMLIGAGIRADLATEIERRFNIHDELLSALKAAQAGLVLMSERFTGSVLDRSIDEVIAKAESGTK